MSGVTSRKRNSTWYRHLQREKNEVFGAINNKIQRFTDRARNSDIEFEDFSTNQPNQFQYNNDCCSNASNECGERSPTLPNDSLSICTNNNAFASANNVGDMNCQSLHAITNHSFNADPLADPYVTGNFSVSNSDTSIKNELSNWAVSQKIPHNALNKLLNILLHCTENDLKDLPKDSRTLLKTPKNLSFRNVAPGQYCHIGIKKGLEDLHQKSKVTPNCDIRIKVNIDGLPLAKSTSSQVYPILGITKIFDQEKVFLIGCYHGYSKPKEFNDFLSDFIDEAVNLTENGLVICGRECTFKISMILMDAVAKASVLYIKGHSGYSSCTKCTQQGEYYNDRVVFPSLNCELRTHADFLAQKDKEHHNGNTNLVQIPGIDLIKDIPLDYMHLVLLGVVKKKVSGIWCFGKPPHKLPARSINKISDNLNLLAHFIPSEFSRKPRSLSEVKRWKATEFRQFLFYTGPVVLKKNISKIKYQHFLTLSVAMSLLSNNEFCMTYTDYAESLLFHYVKTMKEIYGEQFISHNFHNLLHLADDVRYFGSVENFSNFSSENYLHKILNLIRKHDKPLAQIVCRIGEIVENEIPLSNISEENCQYTLMNEYSGGILHNECQGPEYKAIVFSSFKLRLALNDSCCMLEDNSIIEIKNIVFSTNLNSPVLICQKYLNQIDFFKTPCPSHLLNIFCVSSLSEIFYVPVKKIKLKLVRLPYEDDHFVVFPLLHQNEH